MDNDEKEQRKPPAWKVDDFRNDIRDRVSREVHDRIGARMRRRSCGRDGYGGLVPGAVILAVGIIFLLGSSRVDLQACKLEYSIVSPK